jgi:hypothetical protein
MRNRTIIAWFFLAATCAAYSGFDEPLYFKNADDVRVLTANPPKEWHPQFREAVSHLVLYAPSDIQLGEEHRESLILSLSDGRTPRQLMVLGYLLRLESLKRALAEDERRIARGEKLSEEDSIEESRKLFELRISRSRTYIDYGQRQILDLLKTEPNQALEPTPTAVTDPAAQAPRQP